MTTTEVRFRREASADGYRYSASGRWAAREKPGVGITLTDTTRRARFESTGASWCRCATWAEARQVAGVLGA